MEILAEGSILLLIINAYRGSENFVSDRLNQGLGFVSAVFHSNKETGVVSL